MVATDHDAWEIIGPETLKFYRTRGTERLDGLLGRFASGNFCGLSRTSGQNTSCQVAGVRPPIRIRVGGDGLSGVSRIDLRRICEACQSRKSYQLFGLDLTTWEVIVAGKSDEVPLSSDLGGDGRFVLYNSWTSHVSIHRIKLTRITKTAYTSSHIRLTPDQRVPVLRNRMHYVTPRSTLYYRSWTLSQVGTICGIIGFTYGVAWRVG